MIGITRKEYNAIVYAYARLQHIVEHGDSSDQTKKSDQSCVNVLDKFIDRVNGMLENEEEGL